MISIDKDNTIKFAYTVESRVSKVVYYGNSKIDEVDNVDDDRVDEVHKFDIIILGFTKISFWSQSKIVKSKNLL